MLINGFVVHLYLGSDVLLPVKGTTIAGTTINVAEIAFVGDCQSPGLLDIVVTITTLSKRFFVASRYI